MPREFTQAERDSARITVLSGQLREAESKLAQREAEVEEMRLSYEVWQQHSDADIAVLFHEHYERLAPEFRHETQAASRVDWSMLTSEMRGLMSATVSAVRLAMVDKALAALTPAPKEPNDG